MNAPIRSSADTARPGSDEQDAPASPAPPQGEREAFEAWALEEQLAYRDQNGFWFYEAGAGYLYWKGWQARASLSASTQPAAPGTLAENEQRLMDLLAGAGLARSPAMDDLVRLIFDARKGRAAQPAVSAEARDAARYRWLREQDWFSGPMAVLREPKRVLTRGIGLGADCPSHHRLDAAIDAAMDPPPADNKENGNVR